MFPVVGTGTTRVNPKKDVLLGNGKLYVPRGTIVWIGQHALMNCQANWSDPDKFIPERWAQVRMKGSLQAHTLAERQGMSSEALAGATDCDLLVKGLLQEEGGKGHLLHTGCLMSSTLKRPIAVLGGRYGSTTSAEALRHPGRLAGPSC